VRGLFALLLLAGCGSMKDLDGGDGRYERKLWIAKA
jgi:hypothetical protein